MLRMFQVVAFGVALAAHSGSPGFAADDVNQKPPAELLGMPLVYFENFESGNASRWEPSDAKAWKVVEVDGNHVYSLFQQSEEHKLVRSPFNRSVIKDLLVGDFVLDVRMQSTTRDYEHRDLCLFFGFQDPTHLHYVHFGKKTDQNANQIFIVNGEPRVKVSTETTPGTNWTSGWHHARVVRKVDSGTVDVYFDDMEKPVMKAVDKTLTWGQIGVGSFDDTGNFDSIAVYGRKVERPAAK